MRMKRILAGVALAILLSVSLNAALLRAEGATAWLAEAMADAPIAEAASRGDRETVMALLKKAADVNAAQGDGMTALHWAAMNGDVEMTQMLLVAGANVRATTRLGTYTPLYLASQQGHAPVIEA